MAARSRRPLRPQAPPPSAGPDGYSIPRTAPEALRPYVDLLSESEPEGVDLASARLGLLMVWLADDIETTVNEQLAAFGISEKKLDVLLLLMLAEREVGGESLLSPSAIADYFGVTRTTVTGLLDFLEKRKLIRRMNHPDDRRRIQTRLTPAGRALVTAAGPVFWRACGALTAPLDTADKRALERIFGKVYFHMKTGFAAAAGSKTSTARTKARPRTKT